MAAFRYQRYMELMASESSALLDSSTQHVSIHTYSKPLDAACAQPVTQLDWIYLGWFGQTKI
ncbi:uncharacterized protein K441DRAFT_664078 [Cenococcum geophilum 1.58]|uniref:uncharacterized protein n=1 Tax=Cenococcum geophilum 1.58 TaxID=794803 RepID=UPI00358E2391|nr:hypothetical protein K441DRAFT_664078 [Cenococcum geophilum 1.58]